MPSAIALTVYQGAFQARRTRRAGVQPQLHRDVKYAAMRAASNVILRDMNVSLIIYEMYHGANVIYADFTDYDEIAHHSGPERVEALEALDGIDAALANLVQATADAPRPYKFIVLSDHGQSLGATFKQRYGQSLGEVVRDLMGRPGNRHPDQDPGGGLHVRQLGTLGGDANLGRHRHRYAGGAGEEDDGWRSRPGSGPHPASS